MTGQCDNNMTLKICLRTFDISFQTLFDPIPHSLHTNVIIIQKFKISYVFDSFIWKVISQIRFPLEVRRKNE